jgi:hypothetical protein
MTRWASTIATVPSIDDRCEHAATFVTPTCGVKCDRKFAIAVAYTE